MMTILTFHKPANQHWLRHIFATSYSQSKRPVFLLYQFYSHYHCSIVVTPVTPFAFFGAIVWAVRMVTGVIPIVDHGFGFHIAEALQRPLWIVAVDARPVLCEVALADFQCYNVVWRILEDVEGCVLQLDQYGKYLH